MATGHPPPDRPATADGRGPVVVAGNWKMHGDRALARALATASLEAARAAASVEVVLFPPALLLPTVVEVVGTRGPVSLGGQQCHWEAEGAHTAGLSAAMWAEAGCRYVLVGHSEVRREWSLSDDRVRDSADAGRASRLRPLVCVGETAGERAGGRTEAVVAAQLDAVFGSRSAPLDADVAYEPVWAIGTGRSASPAEAGEVHGALRARLDGHGARRSRILYGGSVSPLNIGGFLSEPAVDGVLVGGASLRADAFTALVAAARAAADRRRT